MSLIKCPKCGAELEITEALKHQFEEQIISSLEAKHKQELLQTQKTSEEEANKRASEKFDFLIASLRKEKDEEKERNKKLMIQLDELLVETRKLRTKDEEREMEMKKRLMDEEEKIKQDARKKAEEEHQLKDLEKDKKLKDLGDQVTILNTKLQQGSQQTQGESLELEIEQKLTNEFRTDIINEVKKGQRGADVVQEVIDKLGRNCGIILWESKNAVWSEGWIAKLKEDQRQAKADLAVLISVNLPQGVDSFIYKDGIWIVSWKHFIPLAWALRYNLVSLYHEKQSSEGKDEKMKILYQYLTSVEFTHRIEGIVDAFSVLQDELEKEKRYFNTKWARQEKEIRKVIDHTHGMYGDLQGIIGKSLPEIKTLELPSGSDELKLI